MNTKFTFTLTVKVAWYNYGQIISPNYLMGFVSLTYSLHYVGYVVLTFDKQI